MVGLGKVDQAGKCLTLDSDVIQPVDVVQDICMSPIRCSSIDEITCSPGCPDLLPPTSALDAMQSRKVSNQKIAHPPS